MEGQNWTRGYERAVANKKKKKREGRSKSGDSRRKIRKEETHLEGMITEVQTDRIIRDPETCGSMNVSGRIQRCLVRQDYAHWDDYN